MGAASSVGVGDSKEAEDITRNSAEACSEGANNDGSHASTSGKDIETNACAGASDSGAPFREFSPIKRTTFDNLPDEVLIKILAAVSASAEKPADAVAPAMTCRRWRAANTDKEVRRRTSRGGLGIRPKHWGEGAVWFLQRLCDAGCLEACFMLGMILLYCIPGGQPDGGRLLLHSANAGHAASLHNLGIMSFTGSGFNPQSKDFRSGLALCAKAAALGHSEAMREVGLCLLDGFGVKSNHVDGWRLILKAHLAEMGIKDELAEHGLSTVGPKRRFSDFDEYSRPSKRVRSDVFGNTAEISKDEQGAAVARLLDGPSVKRSEAVGVSTPAGAVAAAVMQLLRSCKASSLPRLRPMLQQLEAPIVDVPEHPAHQFIAEWFQSHDDTAPVETVVELMGKGVASVSSSSAGKCSRAGCGRRELRPLEFWRCASCWNSRYCSRSCQVRDWKCGHSAHCKPVEAIMA